MKNQYPSAQIFVALVVAFFLNACGAPLKRADDVSKIFENAQDLAKKMTNLCDVLRTRNSAPNFSGIGISNELCANPGLQAVDYPKIGKSLSFSFVDTQSTAATAEGQNSIFTIRTKSEIWMGKSLLQMASLIFDKLNSETQTVVNSGGSGTSANNTVSFKIIGKPTFDKTTWELALSFVITSTRAQNGQVDINNEFKIAGKLLDNKYFAAVAETTADQLVSTSILKNGKILILLIPHAGDLYLQAGVDLNFYSFGVDASFKEKILEALGGGLKAIPDMFAGLQQ